MPETAMTTEWDKIDKLKEKYPEMMTFTDVPKGMEFVSVKVNEESCNMINISYCFSKNDNNILVLQEYYTEKKEQTRLMENVDEYINYNGYRINIKQEDKKMVATIFTNNSTINIIGAITERETFSFIDKMKEAS